MKVICIFLWVLFYSASSWANTAESCPSVESVTLRAGIYTAPAAKAGSEWIAVSGAPSASRLESFEAGVFYPESNQQGSVGKIGYCEYKTQDRSRVSLHYRQSSTEEHSMRLLNVGNWTFMESGLGLKLYECTVSNPGACAFSILE